MQSPDHSVAVDIRLKHDLIDTLLQLADTYVVRFLRRSCGAPATPLHFSTTSPGGNEACEAHCRPASSGRRACGARSSCGGAGGTSHRPRCCATASSCTVPSAACCCGNLLVTHFFEVLHVRGVQDAPHVISRNESLVLSID